MRFLADLHLHSRHSMATSGDMSPEGIWRWAGIKGITVVGTGDFTHPLWFEELKDKLWPDGNGLFALKRKHQGEGAGPLPPSRQDVRFMLSAEVNCIYKKHGKTRRVHLIVTAPAFQDAQRINERLRPAGNLSSDGRPILKLDAKALLEIVLGASPHSMLIPAHAWTPHYSVFGAETGFESLEECFEELTPHIHAIETGLSSDPRMNRLVSGLDRLTLVSNSDAHSPKNIGREANILDTGVSYAHIENAVRTGKGFAGTVEFFPEAGKYHLDGHRSCGLKLHPEDTIKRGFVCPVCGKRVTVGVLNRVHALSDRPEGHGQAKGLEVHYVVPLVELIAGARGKSKTSKTVIEHYFRLIGNVGSELQILLEAPLSSVEGAGPPGLSRAIKAMRMGEITVDAGYDGRYGSIKLPQWALTGAGGPKHTV